MVEAVAFHHEPARCSGNGFSPLTAVHAANHLEHEMGPRGANPPPSGIDEAYLARLGLEDRLREWRKICAKWIGEERRRS